MHGSKRILCVLGATASGKSRLAAELGARLGGEVIGADSMQIYKQLNAASAKPDPEELALAPHHLINIVDSRSTFTLSDWLLAANRVVENCHQRGVIPIIVGGTNLYVKSLLHGLFPAPSADEVFRNSLDSRATGDLYEELCRVDSVAGKRISMNDRRRITRALEVYHLTGRTISSQQREWSYKGDTHTITNNSPSFSPHSAPVFSFAASEDEQCKQRELHERLSALREDRLKNGYTYLHNPIMIGIHWPKELLVQRINKRVDAYMESLMEETVRLRDSDQLGKQARECLGTKQLLQWLSESPRSSREELAQLIKTKTWQYAKTQRTWVKQFQNVFLVQVPAEATDAESQRVFIEKTAVEQCYTHVHKELNAHAVE